MPTAVCLIRTQPHYKHEAFVQGLTRIGYQVSLQPIKRIGPEDVLVIWNRGSRYTYEARRHELAKSRIMVAENGYLDARDDQGHQWFSLAMNHHNGPGWWPVGAGDRWAEMGMDVQPWRREGSHVLVLPQRGIGAPGVAMPPQ